MPILKVIIKVSGSCYNSRFMEDKPDTVYAYAEADSWQEVKRIVQVNGIANSNRIEWAGVQAFYKDIGTPTKRFVMPVYPPLSIRGEVAAKPDFTTGWLTPFMLEDMREPSASEALLLAVNEESRYVRVTRKTKKYEQLAQKITDNLYDGVDVIREMHLDQIKGIVLATLVEEGE